MVDYFANPPEGIDLAANRTPSNNAIGITLFVLAAIAVVLRLIVRLHFQRVRLGADDYFMFAGLVAAMGNLSCCLAGAVLSGGVYGLGRHIWALKPYNMEKITIITFAYVFIYTWSITLIKYSIILFYRRLFGMNWLAWWCVFLTAGYLISNHVVLPLYCQPLRHYWLQWYDPTGGTCPIDEANFYLVVGIINLIGDIFILLVPVPSVWRLQMPRGQKIAVSLIFLLGGFVCIASLIRIRVIVELTQTTDISWAKSNVFIWSSVEPSVGIISGCLPTLRPLLTWVLHKWFGYAPRVESAHGVSPIETISKKRTRTRPRRTDNELEETQFENDDNMLQSKSRHRVLSRFGSENGGKARPGDDEVCLTTIVASKGNSNGSLKTNETSEQDTTQPAGIVVKKQFGWDEEDVG